MIKWWLMLLVLESNGDYAVVHVSQAPSQFACEARAEVLRRDPEVQANHTFFCKQTTTL